MEIGSLLLILWIPIGVISVWLIAKMEDEKMNQTRFVGGMVCGYLAVLIMLCFFCGLDIYEGQEP